MARQEIKSVFSSMSATKPKIKCLKKAYSHKILRYLVYKIEKEDIQKLNTKLPYLSFDIVIEALNIVKK